LQSSSTFAQAILGTFSNGLISTTCSAKGLPKQTLQRPSHFVKDASFCDNLQRMIILYHLLGYASRPITRCTCSSVRTQSILQLVPFELLHSSIYRTSLCRNCLTQASRVIQWTEWLARTSELQSSSIVEKTTTKLSETSRLTGE
jgi:hypothetical protein